MIRKEIDDEGDYEYLIGEYDFHNPHGPAIKGKLYDIYILNDICHNIVGPCEIHHKENYKVYYINGYLIL